MKKTTLIIFFLFLTGTIFGIIGFTIGQTVYYEPDHHVWGYGIEYVYEGITLHIPMQPPIPPTPFPYEIMILGIVVGAIVFGVFKAATKKWAIISYDEAGTQHIKWTRKQPTVLHPNESESMIQVVSHKEHPIVASLEKEVEYYQQLATTNLKEIVRDLIRKV